MAGRTWAWSMASWGVLLTLGMLWYVLGPGARSRHIYARLPECPGFDGNSDFYGLGIRIGIYLQWVSSWISNTLNPLAAASNHDANSVFVLAVLIALVVAIANEQIQPIEAYVMLLMSNGFIFTVLSFIGIRIRLYQPGTLAEFLKFSKTVWNDYFRHVSSQLQHSGKPQGILAAISWAIELTHAYTFRASFSAASRLKHPALSWAGVAWRSAVGSFIAALNIWLWWVPSYWENNSLSCQHAIYFFGERQLSHDVRTFFRVASIIVMAPTGYYFLLFCSLALMALKFLWNTILYHSAVQSIDVIMGWETGLSDKGKQHRATLLQLLQSGLFDSQTKTSGEYLMSLLDMVLRRTASGTNSTLELLTNRVSASGEPTYTVPQLKEALQAFAAFYSRGIDADAGTEVSASRSSTTSKLLCVLTHAVILAVMACFIAFIELTITASGISGVHTIGTTGQLIPFVLGIMSFVMAARELLMLYLRKMLPDWKDHAFTMGFGLAGNTSLGVTKVDQSVAAPGISAGHMQASATDTPASSSA